MCGVVGFLSNRVNDPTTQRRLGQATGSLRRRGPDGSSNWIEDNQTAGLGHTRLAVNGGRASAQPMISDDGMIVAVVNGELYDPDDQLRQRLIAKGCSLRTSGDSELALHLYQHHGADFTQYLRGEFAILIYDRRSREMIAVRDRFGIKPLLYAIHDHPAGGRELWLGSQTQALFAAGVNRSIDDESFFHAMSFQYTLPDRTLYKNVYQVLPGQLISFSQARHDIELQTQIYWDLDYPTIGESDSSQPRQQEGLVEEFRHRLTEATQMRLRGDVPAVAHLSGGIDSCSVLRTANRDSFAAAFTVQFPTGDQYDERCDAELVANQCGVPLHVVSANPDQLIDALPEAVAACGGLAANGHLPAKYLLSQAIHQHGYKVALTGEGGDELLAGYPHLRVDHCRSNGHGGLADSISNSNPASRGVMLPTDNGLNVQSVQKRLGYLPTFLAAKASLGKILRSHLRDDFIQQYRDRDAYDELIQSVAKAAQVQGRSVVHQSLYLWCKTALSQNILKTLGDGCESSHAVEGRLPMLDHELFDWCKQLPANMFIRQSSAGGTESNRVTEKWILRTAMRDRLPSRIVSRPKHPFIAPPLLRADAQSSNIRDAIETAADQHEYFDGDKVRKTLNQTIELANHTAAAPATDAAMVANDPLWWTLMSSLHLTQPIH